MGNQDLPGRKTDVQDAEWLAELMLHGLLKASFVPNKPQRALRDLIRYQSKLVEDFFDQRKKESKISYLTRQLEKLTE